MMTKEHEGNKMSKLSRGAFSMVLAGAVTFSVTNALLIDQSSKNVADETAITISEDEQKAEVTNEKAVKNQPPTTNEKDGQAIQGAIENDSESVKTEAVVQQNIKKTTEATTIKPANVNTSTTPVNKNVTTAAPVTATIPAPVPKAPTTTTTPVPTTSGANTTGATKPTINNGQQVSQNAKEKAAIRQDTKENNGKNM